jgi:beta-aspartyl-peptidase (threonine type)
VRPGVIVHGGAGDARMDPARLARYREGLAEAALAGFRALAGGGSALDAVEAAVRAMEASGAFNAGVGSCLNLEREVECDAAVMVGEDARAGACGAVRRVKHPVTLARRIAEATDHVLLVGAGAERLAEGLGLEGWTEPPTPERLREHDEIAERWRAVPRGERLARLALVLRHGAEARRARGLEALDTVGAVAIDAGGRLASAVSTGGLWLKLPGRVGDAALPGAGIWADDRRGAASATGIGEAIIRVGLARTAVDGMGSARTGVDVAIAALSERIGRDTAGVIAIDASGSPAAAMNTRAMGRAYLGEGMDAPAVAVEREEAFV